MTGWYPWSTDLAADADETLGIDCRFHRLPERASDIFKLYVAEFHIVLWNQADDKDENDYVEMCAFGYDGYAAKIPLAEFLDKMLNNHLLRDSRADAELDVKALEHLRAEVDRMIEERKAALKSETEPADLLGK